jgi:hypothetical protein
MTQNVITRHFEMLIRGEATAAYCISIAYESSIRNSECCANVNHCMAVDDDTDFPKLSLTVFKPLFFSVVILAQGKCLLPCINSIIHDDAKV